jgi:hypothetical protein
MHPPTLFALTRTIIAFGLATASTAVLAQSQPLAHGIFTDHQDVGTVLHPGSTIYDDAAHTYTLSGSGENMWFGIDDFQFAWKKVSGDVALTADIAFLGLGGNPHRKAVLMIRQSLDGASPAVDVALHGVGLTSLQFRDAPGANVHEVESNISAPRTVPWKSAATSSTPLSPAKMANCAPPALQPSSISPAISTSASASARTIKPPSKRLSSPTSASISFQPRPDPQLSSARSKPSASLPPTATSNTPPPRTLRRPTGPETASSSSSIRMERSTGSLLMAANLRSFPPRRRRTATTTTASRPTASLSPSATHLQTITNPASTSFPSPAALPARSPLTARRTGTAGRPTAKPSPSPASA